MKKAILIIIIAIAIFMISAFVVGCRSQKNNVEFELSQNGCEPTSISYSVDPGPFYQENRNLFVYRAVCSDGRTFWVGANVWGAEARQ